MIIFNHFNMLLLYFLENTFFFNSFVKNFRTTFHYCDADNVQQDGFALCAEEEKKKYNKKKKK